MTAAGSEQRPQRRAGTFTLGVTLVAAGAAMLASWFWPGFQPQWLVNASPGAAEGSGMTGRGLSCAF